MDKTKCQICNGVFSEQGMAVHVKRKHDMSIQEYNKQYPEVTQIKVEENEFEEEPVKEVVTPNDIKKATFGNEKEDRLSGTLSEFLKEQDIELDDLLAVIKSFKEGTPLHPVQDSKHQLNKAYREIGDITLKEELRITHLETAELLTEEQGYECVEVIGRRGNSPKTWVLKRKR